MKSAVFWAVFVELHVCLVWGVLKTVLELITAYALCAEK